MKKQHSFDTGDIVEHSAFGKVKIIAREGHSGIDGAPLYSAETETASIVTVVEAPGFLGALMWKAKTHKFAIGQRVNSAFYGLGTIVGYDGTDYKVRFDGVNHGGKWGAGLYWANESTLRAAGPALSPHVSKPDTLNIVSGPALSAYVPKYGDLVTFGTKQTYYTFIGMYEGSAIIAGPHRVSSNKALLHAPQVDRVDPKHLSLYTPEREVKVDVEIARGRSGKLIAYATSEEEGFPRAGIMPDTVARQTITMKVPL